MNQISTRSNLYLRFSYLLRCAKEEKSPDKHLRSAPRSARNSWTMLHPLHWQLRQIDGEANAGWFATESCSRCRHLCAKLRSEGEPTGKQMHIQQMPALQL